MAAPCDHGAVAEWAKQTVMNSSKLPDPKTGREMTPNSSCGRASTAKSRLFWPRIRETRQAHPLCLYSSWSEACVLQRWTRRQKMPRPQLEFGYKFGKKTGSEGPINPIRYLQRPSRLKRATPTLSKLMSEKISPRRIIAPPRHHPPGNRTPPRHHPPTEQRQPFPTDRRTQTGYERPRPSS